MTIILKNGVNKMPMKIEVGDIAITKKNHPCGSNRFKMMRVGADFRIKCLGCEKQIWIARNKFEKRIKKIEKTDE